MFLIYHQCKCILKQCFNDNNAFKEHETVKVHNLNSDKM